MIDALKPGWKTSEFWLALIKLAGTLALAAGVIGQADVNTLSGAAAGTVAAVFAILGNASIVRQYMDQRFALKAPAIVVESTAEPK